METKNIKTTKCEDCGYDIRNNNISKHIGSKSCARNKVKTKFKAKFTVLESGDCKCDECGFITNKQGIKGHYWKKHTKEGNNQENNIGFENGTRIAWNKGLTKEDSEIIVKQAALQSKTKKSNPRKVKHSEETKKKLSNNKISFYEKNPDKIPYRLYHSSKESYPEKLLREYFEANNITGWIQEYPFGMYSFDFAFVDKKLDVEIDGATHLLEKVKIADKRRDEKSKSEGWRVLRFTASEIKSNIYECVNKILEELK